MIALPSSPGRPPAAPGLPHHLNVDLTDWVSNARLLHTVAVHSNMYGDSPDRAQCRLCRLFDDTHAARLPQHPPRPRPLDHSSGQRRRRLSNGWWRPVGRRGCGALLDLSVSRGACSSNGVSESARTWNELIKISSALWTMLAACAVMFRRDGSVLLTSSIPEIAVDVDGLTMGDRTYQIALVISSSHQARISFLSSS